MLPGDDRFAVADELGLELVGENLELRVRIGPDVEGDLVAVAHDALEQVTDVSDGIVESIRRRALGLKRSRLDAVKHRLAVHRGDAAFGDEDPLNFLADV